jgi:hypothetical protein
MRPSPFLSSTPRRPVTSQVFEPVGQLFLLSTASPCGPSGHMVVMMFRRAIAPTAGAVRYSSAMNTSAQPADQRASATFGTVKKRMITCGRPAVPIISDRV